jgi:hypothetical protein
VSTDGFDFVMKKGSGTCDSLAAKRPVSVLHLQGRHLPGETAEQWRGEGFCERVVLTKEMVQKLPSYTITSIVASKRMEKEKGDVVEELNDGVSGVRRSTKMIETVVASFVPSPHHLFDLYILLHSYV